MSSPEEGCPASVTNGGGRPPGCPPRLTSTLVVHGRLFWSLFVLIAAGCLLALPASFSLAAPSVEAEALATVGDSVITVQEYAMALRSEARRRFYHFKPPEAEMAAFRREVAEQLVERTLLVQEAKRRGLRPDSKITDQRMQVMRARVEKGNAQQHAGEAFWAALRKQIEQDQLVEKLRAQEQARISPTDAKLRDFYRNNPDKFTEPERLRVSVILLRVNPSSPASAWEAARREAKELLERIGKGADFAELARLHSSDGSAAKGGDMGYLHKGMLSAEVEEALAKARPGEVTAPLSVLEGIAVFKLTDRQPARLAEYKVVKQRAAELWTSAEEERAWKALIANLRSTTTVKIEEKYLTPG